MSGVPGSALSCCLLSWVAWGGSCRAGFRAGEAFQAGRQEGRNTYMALEGRTEPFTADAAVPSCTIMYYLSVLSPCPPPVLTCSPLRQQVADRCLQSPRSGFVPAYTIPVSCDGLKGRSLV